MTPRGYLAWLGLLALLLLSLAAVGGWGLWNIQHDVVVWLMLGMALVYAGAAWLVTRQERRFTPITQRHALLLIVGTAAAARCLLVAAPPLSTDIYRYVWDGRVQGSGINPYRYRPADAQLGFLRDAAVFPKINRAATAVTIYPPFAQMIFAAVTRIADSVTGMKAAMVAFEVAAAMALLALLRDLGLPATRIIFYAWHPLPLFEFSGSGHIDAAAIALLLLACLAAQRRRPAVGGVLLGCATLVKFFPLVIAPALYRRWGWRLPAALLAACVLLYLPYLSVGRQVLGFLPGYAAEEGLADGSGFFLLDALGAWRGLPGWAAAAYVMAGGAVLAAIGAAVVMRRDAAAIPLGAALLLLAVFTLIVSPHLPWYFTWVVPFLCFRPSWALIYLSAAAPLLYAIIWAPESLTLHAALYVPFALILGVEFYLGRRRPPLELSNDGNLGPRHAG